MAKKKTNGVWKMELDRFGYTLVVIGQTAEECDAAMREEYIKAYASRNDVDEKLLRDVLLDPAKYETVDDDAEYELDEREFADLYNGNEFLNYYRDAMEECSKFFYEFGKVEWT